MAKTSLLFNLSRVLLGMTLLAFGYYIFQFGHLSFEKYVHALRKMFF